MFALFRSSAFWLSLFAGAWLALDPIVKCSFVVVHQHLQSRHEGDDLRGLLASLPREQQKKSQMIASTAAGGRVAIGALVLLAAILAGTSPMASARAAQASLTRSSTGTPADTRARHRFKNCAARWTRNRGARFIAGMTLSTRARLPGLTSYWIRSGTVSSAPGMRFRNCFANYGHAG